MKKVVVLVLAVAALGGGVFYLLNRKSDPPKFRTAPVERGSIVSAVSATGTLSAVVTVQVGTQVSGTIQTLHVDYNSPVKKGEAIAEIDPSLFQAQVDQSRGNYLNAEANLAKARVALTDAKRTLERNRQLLRDGIVSQGDFDAAETAYASAQAGLRAAEGAVVQTRGAYNHAQTNLRNATIRSPVDGTVISRSVDVGQTVAASFQTPTLFTIAQDLTKMRIETSVDEADIGKVQLGHPVTFTVDAYPETEFKGEVSQIRNAAVVNQNVVTYTVVVSVDNADLKLKPGMTANVSILTSRKDNVLKVPNAALRFRPKNPDEEEKKDKKPERRRGGAGGQQVYVLDAEGNAKAVPVKTGMQDDSATELVSGNLKEGDEVIVDQVLPKKKAQGGRMPRGPGF
jgi:HlyD family secretion protein